MSIIPLPMSNCPPSCSATAQRVFGECSGQKQQQQQQDVKTCKFGNLTIAVTLGLVKSWMDGNLLCLFCFGVS